jgi:putative membrane protein
MTQHLRTSFVLALGFSLLAVAPAFAATGDAQYQSLDQMHAADALADIHHVDQKEIKLGKLALEKSQSDIVKAYAQKMVNDHQAADSKVMLVAKNENVDLKSFQPSDCEESKMESFNQLSGNRFDEAYLDSMRTGHQMVYNQLKMTAASLKDSQVKDLINSILPTVKDHQKIAMADEKQVVQAAGQASQESPGTGDSLSNHSAHD